MKKNERTKKSPRRRRRARMDRRGTASRRVASTRDVLARVREGLALVRSMAAQIAAHHPIDACEAVAFGNVGLVQAARSFRARSGVPFRAWAAIRIRGAILDGVRCGGTVPRPLYGHRGGTKATSERHSRHLAGMVTASELGVVSSLHARDERTRSPEQALVDAERRLALRNALACLPPRERAIVDSHYFGGESLVIASRGVGASKSWGSRLHAQALRRLRRELARADQH